MWQTHSRTLQQIISRRRQANQTEPHSFLVLVICLVDTYALLSGSGDGAFVDFIMKNNMLAPQDCLPPLAPGNPRQYFEEELPYFPAVLELNQQVINLATKVGGTARALRAEDSQQRINGITAVGDEHKYKASSQNRVREVQTLCRTLASEWEVRYPQYWSRQPAPKILPYRVRAFCDHVSVEVDRDMFIADQVASDLYTLPCLRHIFPHQHVSRSNGLPDIGWRCSRRRLH
jgi:hypothetical protein